MSKKAHNVVPFAKFDFERLVISDLIENDRIPSQKIAYVSYKDAKRGDGQCDIQGPEQLLDNYGIPDANGPYFTTVKQRAFVKVPLEVNNLTTSETEKEREARAAVLADYKQFLINLDKYMIDNKDKFFGSAKAAKKYTYQPIVRKS